MAVVYGRRYGDEVLSFEPSGALWEASLVMRDRETDSWWSIITGEAVGGELKGQKLVELAAGEKIRWGEWKKRHPDSLVLSVDGHEHDPRNPYQGYVTSERTFQHVEAKDPRLPAKEPVFAFTIDGAQYAVPHAAVEGGASIVIGDREVFLYRREGADVFESTRACTVELPPSGGKARLEKRGGTWMDSRTGAEFKEDADGVDRLTGFDTFWYNLANIIPGSVILEKSSVEATELEIQLEQQTAE